MKEMTPISVILHKSFCCKFESVMSSTRVVVVVIIMKAEIIISENYFYIDS